MKYQWNVAITAQCEPSILTGGLEDFKFACIGGGGGGWKIFKITRGRDPYVTMI